jgi:hypothetical protein
MTVAVRADLAAAEMRGEGGGDSGAGMATVGHGAGAGGRPGGRGAQHGHGPAELAVDRGAIDGCTAATRRGLPAWSAARLPAGDDA